jgi:lipopolysaccharide transport system permease protein
MLARLGTMWRWRELLWILIGRNLKIRYKGSTLGFFWSLLGPLLIILIYAVFAAILRFNQGRPNYLEFLVIGICIWQFLAMCLNDSLYAVMGNVNLVKKTSFPRIILPIAMVSANVINFLLTWCVLLPYLLVAGMPLQGILLLPVVLVVQAALCLGMALILSTSNVFLRDTEHILGVGTLAWFFLSPIFYPVEMQLSFLPASLSWLAFLNPMTGIVWCYRRLLMGSEMPDLMMVPAASLLTSFLVCFSVLLIGLITFLLSQKKFGDVL